MSKKIVAIASATVLLGNCLFHIPYSKPVFRGKIENTSESKFNFKTDKEKLEDLIKTSKELKHQEEEKLKIQEQERTKREKELATQKENTKKNVKLDRGGNNTYKAVDVTIKTTYYTNINNAMQGGQYDKRGKLLTSYKEPIVAVPKDIPYGSYLKINGTMYKCVDTGGAIVWLKDGTMRVDIFVPNVSEGWIVRNKKNETLNAKLYIKNK